MSEQMVEKEEAGFLDVFIILLKYRVLIIIGMLLTLTISGIYFYIIPKFNPVKPSYAVEYTIESVELPLEIERHLLSLQDQKDTVNPIALRAINYFTLKNIVLESYKKHIFDDADISSMDDIQLMTHVNSLINSKFTSRRTSNIIILTCTTSNILEAEAFMKSITDSVNNELTALYSPEIKKFIQTITEVRASLDLLSASGIVTNLVSIEQAKKDGEELLASTTYIKIKGEPYVRQIPPPSKRIMTKFVITNAFAFIGLCCIAFILYGIKVIKNDPQMKHKISSALHKG